MLQLPRDILLLILEYVTTRTDLKSLCLTSTAMRFIAIPLLYERIDIHLWSRENTALFIQCNANGTGDHFRYTRELVVEDEPITEEIGSAHVGVELPQISNEKDDRCQPRERDNNIYQILQMVPDHVLRQFCFFSRRPLTPMMHAHLSSHQKNIRDLRIRLYAEPGLPGYLPQIFCGLECLDLYIIDSTHINLLFDNIEIVGKGLRRLSLSTDNEDVPRQIRFWAWENTEDVTRYTPNLKRLRLSGIDLTHLYVPLSRMIYLPALTHLETSKCEGVQYFISGLGENIGSHGLCLEHLAVDGFHAEPEHLNVCLVNVRQACRPLKSIHISFLNLNRHVFTIKTEIPFIGLHLRRLSLHALSHWLPPDSICLYKICRTLPNLQQLGYQIDEHALLYPRKAVVNYWDFLGSVRRLKELRLLHLRIYQVESGYMKYLSGEMQNFANHFFKDLHREQDHKLDALVIGHMKFVKDGRFSLPQHCFVKGQQKDSLGRTVSVGVPVTRAMLRRTHPYTDILDLDPVVDVWTQWVGRAT